MGSNRSQKDVRNVLVDGTSLSKNMKGVGRYASQLVDAIAEKFLGQARLCVVIFDVPMPSLNNSESIDWLPIPYQSEFRLGMSVIPKLVRRLSPVALIRPADKIGRKYACPTLTVCHDLNPLIWRAGVQRSFNRRALDACWEFWRGYALRNSDIVVCNSEFIRREAAIHFKVDPAKTRLGYCGVDARLPMLASAADTNSLRSQYGSKGFLLAFATGDPREGAEIIPSLFRNAVDCGYPGNLVLAGVKRNTPDADRLVCDFQRAGIDDRLRVLPFLGESELPLLAGLYGAADFYLETSRHEGFGMQLIEAMACGTTCFSSGKGALDEVGGGFALRLDISNPELAGQTVAACWKQGQHLRDNSPQVKHAMSFDWSGAKNAVCEFVGKCLVST